MSRKKPPVEPPPDPKDPILPGVNPVVAHLHPDEGLPFPIVAIGASAGGLEPISALLGAVSSDGGMAFVVIQHLAPSRDSLLTDILGRATSMPVAQVVDRMAVEPNHVYVIPPGKDLVFGDRMLQLAPRSEERGQHRPIDHFMRSLAEEHGHKAIGVVLSGTANDGSQGIQEIKAAGGITIAQDNTAEQPSMPRSAVATGAVDLVLPADEIGRELARIAKHPYVGAESPEGAGANEASLQRVLGILRQSTGVEFAGYKRNTISRRIARRMMLHKVEGLPDYVRYLQSNTGAVDTLFQDLLINVTSFFRNPEAYDALKTVVFPRLAQQRAAHEPVRIWALGCSTGEEAYSLAIAFTEYAEANGLRSGAQIFATDLNGVGIEKARSGIYAKGIAQDVSPERLRRFFVEVDGSYRVVKPIRDMCVFARQNVLADPPFSRLDLVACRNMLIYLDAGLQQRVIPTLHYALREPGFLWLGGSETVGTQRDLFELLDARNKIYAKRPVSKPMGLPILQRAAPRVDARPARVSAPEVAWHDLGREVDRLLVARFAPPAVVVDSNLDIVQFRGDTSLFVSPAPGRASLNLVKMLREGLTLPVRQAVVQASAGKPVIEKGLRVRTQSGWRDVDVEVVPFGAEGNTGYVVLFHEPGASLEAQARQLYADAVTATSHAGHDRGEIANVEEIARLNRELAAMREYLQAIIEQHEAANEELQSANEEVQSSNEELQSVNEEMETSKEEIQSANEELATVNDELQNRNEELANSNNDLVNLLGSAHMAIVMVSSDLRIRRFTPAAEKLFNLLPADIGRPLRDIALHLLTPDFARMVREVIETAKTQEREVRDRDGKWYALRVRPYRTLENRIEGAVVVLVDIDVMKRAEQVLLDLDRGRNEFLAMLAHELRNPLAGIGNAVRLLADSADPHVLGEARAVIERQTAHMVRMVEDLLDVARLTQGKIQLRMEPVDLRTIVNESVLSTAHERAAGEQSIEVAVANEPAWVSADSMRLDQVISNLLNNASKFTRQSGSIWLSVEIEPSAHAGQEVVLRVRDNGMGIDAVLLPHIFDLFVQSGRNDERARTGIGMGLTLVKRLVEMHGGTITAHSAGSALGSEFVVRLPLVAAPPRAAPAAPARQRKTQVPRRILIVDDNVDSAESMGHIFRSAGHELRIVSEGAVATATAQTFRPHAVLLDIGLPDMDGYAVAREMRHHVELADTLIVAVTGYGREDDVRKARNAGIDAHMTKPVNPDKLLEWIAAGRAKG